MRFSDFTMYKLDKKLIILSSLIEFFYKYLV